MPDVVATLRTWRGVLTRPHVLSTFVTTGAGRLARASAPLAVVFVVAASTGSYAWAGVAAGVLTLADAATAPAKGRLADRYGRTLGLLPGVLGYAVALLALAVPADANQAWTLACAAVAGACAPPISGCVKSLLPALVPEGGALRAAYVLESSVQQLLFFAGPAYVAAVTAWSSARVALSGAALCTVAGVLAFVVLTRQVPPGGDPQPSGEQPGGEGGPQAEGRGPEGGPAAGGVGSRPAGERPGSGDGARAEDCGPAGGPAAGGVGSRPAGERPGSGDGARAEDCGPAGGPAAGGVDPRSGVRPGGGDDGVRRAQAEARAPKTGPAAGGMDPSSWEERSGGAGGAQRAPRGGALAVPAVLVLTLVTLLQSIAFGANSVAVAAVAGEGGVPSAAGFVLAFGPVGGLVGGLLIAPGGGRRAPARLVWMLLVAAACYAPMVVLPLPAVAACLFGAGLVVTPLAATCYLLLSDAAPAGLRTEAFAWLSTAVATGSAIGSAVAGQVAELAGARTALLIATGAVLAAAAAGAAGGGVLRQGRNA
ncbi:MFS transporter [Flindersiella endophytica]